MSKTPPSIAFMQRVSPAPRSHKVRVPQPPFEPIGAGTCGTVFAAADEDWVLKRSHDTPPSGEILVGAHLWNEYVKHKRVKGKVENGDACRPGVSVPDCIGLVLGDERYDGWWAEREARFPEGNRGRGCLIVSERVRGFQKLEMDAVRSKLGIGDEHKAPVEGARHESVLFRAYLGRRRRGIGLGGLNLRGNDRALGINQMEKLDLPIEEYARSMAEVLAVLYFDACVDTTGVEFVLAPAREKPYMCDRIAFRESGLGGPDSPCLAEVLGPHTLWMLDFDEVKNVEWDEEEVERCAEALFKSDPYFPRPGQRNENDREMWNVFRNTFLDASEFIIEAKPDGDAERLRDIPERFIAKLESIASGTNRKTIRIVYSLE